MTEREFWGHLEMRVCREFSGLKDKELCALSCYGFDDWSFSPHELGTRIVGHTWIGRDEQEEWEFELIVRRPIEAVEDLKWDELLPHDALTGWMWVDLQRKQLKLDPAIAYATSGSKTTMQPGFNDFAQRIVGRLLPEMETLAIELRARWPDFDINTFSHRHAPVVHALGLWCKAPRFRSDTENDSRGIVINAMGISRLGVAGFVQWNRTYPVWDWRRCRIVRITAVEYRTPPRECDEDDIIRNAPRLYEALWRAMRRGSPPGWLRRCWYRWGGGID